MTTEPTILRPFPVTFPTQAFAPQFMFFAWDIFLNTNRWVERKAIAGPSIAKVIQADSIEEARAEFNRYKKQKGLFSMVQAPQFLFARNHFPDKGGFSRDEIVAVLDLKRFLSPNEPFRPEFHRIFASEETFEQKALNRKHLRQAILSDVGQVMLVYSDPENYLNSLLKNRLEQATPLIRNCEYYPGYRYDLFGFSQEAIISKIQAFFRDKIFTVGDGNHRTRAAKMTAEELTELPSARWLMAALVNLYDPNFQIDPIHRIIRHRSEDFISTFSHLAVISSFNSFETLWRKFEESDNLYAIAACDRHHFYLLEPHAGVIEEIKKDVATPVPVHILNRLLRLHGITREHPDLDTEIEPEDALRTVRREAGAVAFFLKPIPRPVLENAFRQHLIFPEKAFSIVGKVPAGGPMWLFGDHPDF